MAIFSGQEFANGDATNVVVLDGGTGVGDNPSVTLPQGSKYTKHQIAIDAGDNSSGTITALATAVGAGGTEPVYENGAALVINLATADEPLTRPLTNYCVESFSFTFASLGGSDPVKITIASWDMGEN